MIRVILTLTRIKMVHTLFFKKTGGADRWGFFVLTVVFALPLCVSCSSKGGAPLSSSDPYAENAPKSRAEEDYYQDVYSGDWKKQNTNPLGYFGLGRLQASTAPPPHWTMDVPKGAKSMEQIREENYAKNGGTGASVTASAENARSSYSERPVDRTANISTSSIRLPSEARGALHGDALGEGVSSPQSSRIHDEDEIDEATHDQKPKEKKNSLFNGWTQFRLNSSDGDNEMDGILYAGLPFEGKSLIFRGQEPVPEAGRSVTSTANAVSRPIQIDPSIAEPWRYVNGRGLAGVSDRKDLPADEYIADGGDLGSETYAMPNWDIHNLEAEETVAHFDTLSGRILMEPSNRILIYSPRFGSVRQTVGPKSESQNVGLVNMGGDVTLAQEERHEGIDSRIQETGIKLARGNLQATGIGANQPGGSVSGEMGVIESDASTHLASAGGALRESVLSDKDRVAVADGAAAAAAWGEVQGVAVKIDRISAQGNVTLQGAETIYKVKNDTKTSQLRLIKVASKKEAAPGELVEFTIRFENVGTELIGNVTILDSLSPRLEFVEGSAKSSKTANFLVKNNETGSLLLRWEITDPLDAKDFGVLTFLCKVR